MSVGRPMLGDIERLKAELAVERATTKLLAHELVAMDEHGHLVNEDWKSQLDEERKKSKQYRERVTLSPSDVEEAGVTRGHLITWLTRNGWAASQSEYSTRFGRFSAGDYADSLTTWRAVPPCLEGVSVPDTEARHDVCAAIKACAYHFKRSAWEILDEMAALKKGVSCLTDD